MSQSDWENLKDLLVAVIGAMWLGFTTWQNKRLADQNRTLEEKIDRHEARATTRARMRGEPLNPAVEEESSEPSFPYEETSREDAHL